MDSRGAGIFDAPLSIHHANALSAGGAVLNREHSDAAAAPTRQGITSPEFGPRDAHVTGVDPCFPLLPGRSSTSIRLAGC